MDGAIYMAILEEKLFQYARDLRLGQRLTFRQDNDFKHSAKAIMQCFKIEKLNVLGWLSQSPDLNLI